MKFSCCRLASVLAIVALSACGGGGPVPVLSLTAGSTSALAGGPAIELTVTGNGAGSVTWTLSGPGQLDAASGVRVNYVPPHQPALTEDATATVSARSGSAQASVDLAVTGSSSMQWDARRIAGANLTKAAYGGGRFVLLEGGATSGSAYVGDGSTWTRIAPLAAGLAAPAVAYGNGRFVVVGQKDGGGGQGVVLASTDGVTWADVTPRRARWTPVTGDSIGALATVAFADGQFIAVGGCGTTITSVDGVAWTDATMAAAGTCDGPIYAASSATSNGLRFLAAAGGRLWASGILIPPLTHGLGQPGAPWGLNLFAADAGASWTHVARDAASPCYPSGPMAADGSRIISGGYCGESAIVSSASGATWQPPASVGSRARPLMSCMATVSGSLNPNFASVVFGAGRFVAVACGQLVSSVNGTDWGYAGGAVWNDGSPVVVRDVILAGDRFVAVGGPDILMSK